MRPELEFILNGIDKRLEHIESKIEDLSTFKIKLTVIAAVIIFAIQIAMPLLFKLLKLTA